MFNFNVKIDRGNWFEYLRKAQDFRIFNTAIKRFGLRGLNQIKALTPGSGNIASKWRIQYHTGTTGEIRTISIYNVHENENIVLYLEEGTRPHIIPVGAKGFLAFQDDNGKWVFTKNDIHHPGTIAYRMVGLTAELLNSNLNTFTRLLEQMYTKRLEMMGR